MIGVNSAELFAEQLAETVSCLPGWREGRMSTSWYRTHFASAHQRLSSVGGAESERDALTASRAMRCDTES